MGGRMYNKLNDLKEELKGINDVFAEFTATVDKVYTERAKALIDSRAKAGLAKPSKEELKQVYNDALASKDAHEVMLRLITLYSLVRVASPEYIAEIDAVNGNVVNINSKRKAA
jgi:hypothetical protein